jgi:citrate synthase
LAYRGYSIEDLVKYASFEEVAMLLRDGELPSSDALADFQKVLHERYEVKRDIRLMMWALPAPSLSNIATSSNDAYFTKSSIEYPRYAKIPFFPSIEEIEDSVAGTPAKPGIYLVIFRHN